MHKDNYVTREAMWDFMKEEIPRLERIMDGEPTAQDIEEADVAEVPKAEQAQAIQEQEQENLLEATVYKEIKLGLSWGGPADWYTLRFNAQNELLGGQYHRANWGEHESFDLTQEEAEIVYNYYLSGDTSLLE